MMPPFANDGIFAVDSSIQRYYQLLSGPAAPTYSSLFFVLINFNTF